MSVRRLLAAVVLLAALPLPARAAAPRPETREWVLERTGTALTTLDVTLSSSAQVHEPSYAALVGIQGSRARVRDVDLVHVTGAQGDPQPDAYAAGHRVGCDPLGRPPVACAAYSGTLHWTTFSGRETESERFSERFVLVAHGYFPKARLGEGSRGWRLTEVPAAVREVRTEASQTAGVFNDEIGVETFLSAHAVGGARGSIAIGNPPCGAGVATLAGGAETARSQCPVDAPPAAAAPSGTEWSLEGPVAGATSTPYRLIVVDLPLGARPARR